jgi:hypothetical protein
LKGAYAPFNPPSLRHWLFYFFIFYIFFIFFFFFSSSLTPSFFFFFLPPFPSSSLLLSLPSPLPALHAQAVQLPLLFFFYLLFLLLLFIYVLKKFCFKYFYPIIYWFSLDRWVFNMTLYFEILVFKIIKDIL